MWKYNFRWENKKDKVRIISIRLVWGYQVEYQGQWKKSATGLVQIFESSNSFNIMFVQAIYSLETIYDYDGYEYYY